MEKHWNWLCSHQEDAHGFTYIVRHRDTGKFYIGRKALLHTKKLPPLKGRTRARRATVDSGWRKYTTSSDVINAMIKKTCIEDFEFFILSYYESKKKLHAAESILIARYILDGDCLNMNIAAIRFILKDDEFSEQVNGDLENIELIFKDEACILTNE